MKKNVLAHLKAWTEADHESLANCSQLNSADENMSSYSDPIILGMKWGSYIQIKELYPTQLWKWNVGT